jgi:hypothetical protein
MASGFLQEVIKGWYIPSRPDEVKGESTAWYASFWRFAAVYLETRFARNWSPRRSRLKWRLLNAAGCLAGVM